MLVKNTRETQKNLTSLFKTNSSFTRSFNGTPIVKEFLKNKTTFLKLAKRYETPFYLFDPRGLTDAINRFKTAFSQYIPTMYIYYAMKSNPHHHLLKGVVKEGLGIDCSSGKELKEALRTKATSIIFTGPAKKIKELELAVSQSKRVVINLDSMSELQKLEAIIKKKKVAVSVGVRIATKHHGHWNKFGIKLAELSRIHKRIKKNKLMNFIGIQTHMSFNETAESYVNVISEIGAYLKKNKEVLPDLQYIDLGGGFLPHNQHGIHPWEDKLGHISQIVNGYFGPQKSYGIKHLPQPAVPLERYAKEIGSAIKKHLPFYKGMFYFEPGRVIAQGAMHIMLTVEDVKENIAITDGGTNMIGWERFEYDYFPLINLSAPSLTEKEMTIFGALCTPADVWGFYIFAKKINVGDVLLLPNQGAYTFTYAQNFIKEIPPVHSL